MIMRFHITFIYTYNNHGVHGLCLYVFKLIFLRSNKKTKCSNDVHNYKICDEIK